MEYVVGKSFLRNGERYRPGDKPPDDLDKVTLEHYLRHGMLSTAKPSQTKPAGPARGARQPKDKPVEEKPVGPAETQQALPQAAPNDGGAAASGEPVGAQPAAEPQE